MRIKTRILLDGVSKEAPTYVSYRSMKERCYSRKVNHKDYKHYAGRGVQVHPRWRGRDGYQNFYNDMGERPLGHSLDRIDSNGHYEPSNCKWSTPSQQASNRRKKGQLSTPVKQAIFPDIVAYKIIF